MEKKSLKPFSVGGKNTLNVTWFVLFRDVSVFIEAGICLLFPVAEDVWQMLGQLLLAPPPHSAEGGALGGARGRASRACAPSLRRVGVLEDSFTFLGILLAIVLFPFGFACCFALKK